MATDEHLSESQPRAARTSKVLLVVPPFHVLERAALGVSVLKAAVEREGIACDVLYLSFRFADLIGADLYRTLTNARNYKRMLGEWIFAGELFGEAAPDPRRYVDEVLLDRYFDKPFTDRLLELRALAPSFMDDVMAAVQWEQYAVVGATSTYQQNCAGLALLRRVKSAHPKIVTVLGGANCEGEMGAAIHELFPFVDYVCSGEGDRMFPALVQRIVDGKSTAGLPGFYRHDGLDVLGGEVHTPLVMDLDRLPYPNHDDFFAQLAQCAAARDVQPTIAVETSRGCWWGEKHHCTFCGLNGEGMRYRSKSGHRACEELDYLAQRYGVRDFQVVDNILELEYFDSLLKELASRPFPPNLFYETKANLTKDQLRLMLRAGVREFQPGIESFSTPILRLMDKGVTGLQNIRLLKWAEEIGLNVTYAILYGFPGEDPSEYQRMADLVPSLTHLEPPNSVGPIRMDRFSPNFDQAEARGFVNVRPALPYWYVYPFSPDAMFRFACHFDCDYADGRNPRDYALVLRRAQDEWRACRATSRLELRVSDDCLEIVDTRPVARLPTRTLDGPARLAYLALDAGNNVRGVHTALSRALGDAAPAPGQIESWLESWLADRLVLREGERYLGLAVNSAERVRLPAERLAELMRVTAVQPVSS